VNNTLSQRSSHIIEKFIFITAASVIFSLAVFLSKSSQLLTGGTPGVILIINHFFDNIAYGVLYACINVPLFLLSYFRYSKSFTVWSLYAVFLISSVYSIYSENIHLDANPIVIAIISGILQGICLRTLVNNICSPGGLNIPAAYFAEKTKTKLAYWLLGIDVSVLSVSFMIYGFRSWPTILTVSIVFIYLRLTK
jgi:uncharacterized membrane-anchored protein YitT (DUF2179 family)